MLIFFSWDNSIASKPYDTDPLFYSHVHTERKGAEWLSQLTQGHNQEGRAGLESRLQIRLLSRRRRGLK